MKVYADSPARRRRQRTGDLLVLGWTLVWTWIAVEVYRQVGRLGAPGRALQQAGDGLASNLDGAAEGAGRVPVLGTAIQAPLAGAAGSGRALSAAGRAMQTAVSTLSILLALTILVLTVGVVMGQWLPRRVRWIKDAAAAQRLMSAPGGLQVLAVRAAAQQPLAQLAQVRPGVLHGWLRGEEAATAALAALAVRSLGLQPDVPALESGDQPAVGRSGHGASPGRSESRPAPSSTTRRDSTPSSS